MADGAIPEPDAEVRTVLAGPGALYLYIESGPSPEASRFLGAWSRVLRNDRPPALLRAIDDVIPGYTSLLIAYQPGVSARRVRDWALAARPDADALPAPRTHDIAVAYGDHADRVELEQRLGLAFDEIARRHAEAAYTVAFLGFTAGFPYLLGLPEELHVPRRARPTERIPAGAVAIAGAQSGIYPSESPGGWWVLGRTDATLFDPDREPPALLAPGDVIRFRPEDGAPDEATAGSPAAPVLTSAGTPSIRVTEAWPRSVSLQGPSRHGVGHVGMAEAGALDPTSYGEANTILGNPAGAVALEVVGQPVGLRAGADLRAVVTGGGLSAHLDGKGVKRWRAFDWPAGASLELVPDRDVPGATTYLSVGGGFAAHTYAGSGSTDARAGVGGLRRFVARGDELALTDLGATRVERPRPGTPRFPNRIVLRIHPGPQPNAQAWQALLKSSFRVAVLDRTGARLDGPEIALPQHETISEGSPAGAIQIPPDGRPLVLLADRGRTGGYAKPAIIDPRDLWQLAQADARTDVWFEPATGTASDQPVH